MKHRFGLLDFLIENYIFIEKLLFSLDTERMDIIFESVASKRFGWTKYQPIRMLYRDLSSKSVFSQGWSGSKSKQARIGKPFAVLHRLTTCRLATHSQINFGGRCLRLCRLNFHFGLKQTKKGFGVAMSVAH